MLKSAIKVYTLELVMRILLNYQDAIFVPKICQEIHLTEISCVFVVNSYISILVYTGTSPYTDRLRVR